MEFCSRKELELQTGHTADQWPLVVAKELGDNALDACEEGGVQPEVTFAVDTGEQPSITVTDNGPGIAPETITAILDYTTRTSSREAYASPTRGAQGNALKTIIAMPFALSDGEEDVATIIESRGVRHTIRLSVDAVRQEPVITHDREPCARKTGTSVTVQWPVSASSQLAAARAHFLQIARGYALLNPHASITVEWDGEPARLSGARSGLDASGGRAIRPRPHWYDAARFERLVAAYASQHGERTVREFVTEFRGLTGSAKVSEVLQASGLARTTLARSVRRQGQAEPRHPPPAARDAGALEPGEARRPRRDRARAFPRPVRARSAAIPKTFEYKLRAPPRRRRADRDRGRLRLRAAMRCGGQLFTGVNWSPGDH